MTKTMRETKVEVMITVTNSDDTGMELERMQLQYVDDLLIPIGAFARWTDKLWVKTNHDTWEIVNGVYADGPYR